MTDIEGLDIKMDDQMIEIKCQDGSISVSRRSCRLSKLLLLELSTKPDLKELSYPRFEIKYIQYICKYLEYYKDKDTPVEIKKPLESLKFEDICNAHDLEFVNEIMAVNMDVFLELISLSNSMGVDTLFDLLCARFAIMLKTTCLEDLRKPLGFTEEFTELTDEEENRIKEEYPDIHRLLTEELNKE